MDDNLYTSIYRYLSHNGDVGALQPIYGYTMRVWFMSNVPRRMACSSRDFSYFGDGPDLCTCLFLVKNEFYLETEYTLFILLISLQSNNGRDRRIFNF